MVIEENEKLQQVYEQLQNDYNTLDNNYKRNAPYAGVQKVEELEFKLKALMVENMQLKEA